MNKLAFVYRCVAVLVVCCNCAFHFEFSEEEYAESHPQFPDTISFTFSSINWETFDKENAPQAFQFSGPANIEYSSGIESIELTARPFMRPLERIRDKSPPVRPS